MKLTCVYHLMLSQIAWIRKCLITVFTLVRFHPHMDQDMDVEFRLRCEGPRAQTTLPPARTHVGVSVLVVGVQLCELGELHRAEMAGEGAVWFLRYSCTY